ncbi:MAG: hypothetical protein V7L23_18715 [Nostoc sp.]
MVINAQNILAGLQYIAQLFAAAEQIREQNKQSLESQNKTEVTEQKTQP